jgi:hypothetical protein
MVDIICKSDCHFSQNESRTCSLKQIQLNQVTPEGPTLVCSNYVRTERYNQPFKGTDFERAKMDGFTKMAKGKLSET